MGLQANPKLGSLFDGSGGFPLAGAMCGIEPVWASEVEPYPIAVTRERFPNMKHLGDISKINGAEINPVDIITFGSPCQDLSVAGKRAGLKHESNGDEETTRSGLFMEAVRIIKEMRDATNGVLPRFALWENVPGAFSSNKGEDFRIVLEELIKIAEPAAVMPPVPKRGWAYADSYTGDRWSLAYRVFDAQYWGKTVRDGDTGNVLRLGTPQRRRRIHLILDLRGQCAGKILFESEGLRGYFEEGRTPWQGIAPDAQGSLGTADREGTDSGEADPGRNAEGGSHLCGIRESIPGRDANHLGTETGRAGGRGLNAVVPYTLKIRSGCEGGGKGALIQTDRSTTLATNNDQYLFQPVAFEPGIDAREGGHIYEGVSGTIRANAGDNRMAVCYPDVVDGHILDDQGGSQISVREDGKSPTLTSRMGTGGGNVQMILEPTPIHDMATRFSGKRGDKADGKGNGFGVGAPGDPMNTLTSGDRHVVAYGIGNGQANQSITEEQIGTLNCMHDQQAVAYAVDCRNLRETPELYQTLQAKPNGGQSLNFSGAVRQQYIVRRLTPTECARLQGFPDWWGHISEKASLTDEEYRFWLEVRNTHARINGKAEKEYTEAQMLTWYNKLHTDSTEYKMWGNGIALPPALYVMQGIVEALTNQKTK